VYFVGLFLSSLRLEFLKKSVINFVCRPSYVNLVHLVVFTSFFFCASIVRSILFIYLFIYFSSFLATGEDLVPKSTCQGEETARG